MKTVKKLIVFRAPQYDSDLPNQWRFSIAGQLDFSWPIINASGQGYVDESYEGMGELAVITKAQAEGDKRQTLINCAIYSAKLTLPRYGETANSATEVEVR